MLTRDLIILGGGAGGLVVASVAAQLGLKVTLIEKKQRLGGDCLHFGCVPSKTFIYSAHVAHLIKTADQFGLPTIQADIDLSLINQHVKSVIAQIQKHDSVERFNALGCEVLFGDAKFIDQKTLKLNDVLFKAKRFVLATGSRPVVPKISGLDQVQYMTNETVFDLKTLPEHLLILGGGVIGLELAQAFVRLGARVSVIEAGSEILFREETEIRNALKETLMEEGIRFHLNTKVEKIVQTEKTIEVISGDKTVRGDQLLVAIGRMPNIESLELAQAGVQTNSFGVVVNANMRTTNRIIYAVGDVCALPYKLTHMAEYEAGIVISNALFRLRKRFDTRVLPLVIFTDPELARVGLTEQAAKEQHRHIKVFTLDLQAIDRAKTQAAKTGLIKIILKKDRIIGASILSPHAGELISEIALAMQANLSIQVISNTIHPYPTLAQMCRRIVNQYYAEQLFSPKVKKGLAWLHKWLP